MKFSRILAETLYEVTEIKKINFSKENSKIISLEFSKNFCKRGQQFRNELQKGILKRNSTDFWQNYGTRQQKFGI